MITMVIFQVVYHHIYADDGHFFKEYTITFMITMVIFQEV